VLTNLVSAFLSVSIPHPPSAQSTIETVFTAKLTLDVTPGT